jgi:hypothetical protein
MGSGQEKDIAMSFHLISKRWSSLRDIFHLISVSLQMLVYVYLFCWVSLPYCLWCAKHQPTSLNDIETSGLLAGKEPKWFTASEGCGHLWYNKRMHLVRRQNGLWRNRSLATV